MTLVVAIAVVLGGVLARWRSGDRRVTRRRLVGAAALAMAAGVALLGVRAANGGTVPATVDARRTAGQPTVTPTGDPQPAVDRPRLVLLGDIVAWPAPLPLAAPLGLPDLAALVAVGLVALPARRRPGRTVPVQVTAGSLWCEAPTATGEAVEVALPHGRVVVAVGRVGIRVEGRGSAVVVLAGEARVAVEDRTVVVTSGHALAVRPDGAIGQPQVLSSEELAADPWIAPHLRSPPPLAPADPLWRRPPSLVATAATLVVAAMVTTTYVAQVAVVPSGSMEPTLGVGERVVVAKAGGTPGPGDLVVFERPPGLDGENLLLVKRVVAEAGQQVEVRDGQVWVDGKRLREPYLPSGTRTDQPCGPQAPAMVPPATVYVLGDARSASTDSRCFGPVPTASVVGSVVARMWPPGGL